MRGNGGKREREKNLKSDGVDFIIKPRNSESEEKVNLCA